MSQDLLDMVLQWTLVGLLAVTFLQPNAPRFFGALIFTGLIVGHQVLLSDLDGLAYYGSAAIFDLLFMLFTSNMNPVPDMVFKLYKVCIASIVVNALGWMLWVMYWPHLIYNCAFLAIYGWAFAVLIRRDKADVGGFAGSSWRACFRYDSFAWRGYFQNGESKA